MKFKTKIFFGFLAITVAISVALTATFLLHQKQVLLDDLLAEGETLGRLSAYNARLGVLTENKDFLDSTLSGVASNKNVISCRIFALDGRLLAHMGSDAPMGREAYEHMEAVIAGGEPITHEKQGFLEFWFPIFTSQPTSEEEVLFPAIQQEERNERVIGFLSMNVGTNTIRESFRGIVMRGTLIALLSLGVAALAAYLLARRLTDPLHKLQDGVQALGAGDLGASVEVEASDEVGMLANSFNQMSSLLAEREKEKSKLMEQLEQSKRLESLGTLSAGISHDFNNILSIIQHNLDLAKVKSPEYVREYITRSLDATDRGRGLVSRLLDFTSEKSNYSMSVNIALLVQDTVKLFKSSETHYHLDLDIKPGLWTVKGDIGQLHRVMVNLIKNAQDAISQAMKQASQEPEHPYAISISLENVAMPEIQEGEGDAEAPGEYVLMTVRDNGCGMDNSVRTHIFEPFFSTKKPQGSGIGLSAVYGIVKGHGGKIFVRSEPGKGSTFKVFIPRSPEDLIAQPEIAKKPEELVGGNETILIADDEPDILQAMKESLEQMGYNILTANNGQEALQTLTADPGSIDLLILDHIMPELTGLEVIQRMRQQNLLHDVIVYSGTQFDQHEKNLDGVHFISKPFSANDLSRQIRDILGSERAVALKSYISRVRMHIERDAAPPHLSNISDTFTAYQLFRNITSEPREVFLALFLDSSNNLIAYEKLSSGTTNETMVYPKEVVRHALLTNATAIILIHNHPSGNTEPSKEDIIITAGIVQACKVMEVKVMDHLIISDNGYLSMKREGYL